MMNRVSGRLTKIIGLIASILLAISLITFGSPASASAADDPCASEQAALDRNQQQIDTHNAEPHTFIVPEEQAAADAYDAEASQLNSAEAQDEGNLEKCEDTLGTLADEGPNSPPLKTRATPKIGRDINNAKEKLPAEPEVYPEPDADGEWRIKDQLRQLYEAIRQRNTTIRDGSLKGIAKPQIGRSDPAVPGGTIQPKYNSDGEVIGPDVEVDHIITIAELMNNPNFLKLNADNMFMVSRAPLNLQWLSRFVNRAKGSGSVGRLEGLDPAWQDAQVALENSVRAKLNVVIQNLLEEQGGGK